MMGETSVRTWRERLHCLHITAMDGEGTEGPVRERASCSCSRCEGSRQPRPASQLSPAMLRTHRLPSWWLSTPSMAGQILRMASLWRACSAGPPAPARVRSGTAGRGCSRCRRCPSHPWPLKGLRRSRSARGARWSPGCDQRQGQEGRQRGRRHCVDLVEMASPLRGRSRP